MSTETTILTTSASASTGYERFTIASDNIVVHKWLCNPDTTTRAVLILQHGFGEYAERYIKSHHGLIPRLVTKGFEVWAMDLQGHGRSLGNASNVNVVASAAHHVTVRQQATSLGLPIFLFGHSLGGLVTATSVVLSLVGISGVVLSSPAVPAPMSGFGQGAIRLIGTVIPSVQIPKARTPLEKLFTDQEQIRLAEEDTLMYRGQISFSMASSAVEAGEKIWQSLDSWKAPTLVVHGTADVAADVEQSKRLVEKIACLDKELYLVEEGLHELLNAKDPEQTFGHVVDWLDKHLS